MHRQSQNDIREWIETGTNHRLKELDHRHLCPPALCPQGSRARCVKHEDIVLIWQLKIKSADIKSEWWNLPPFHPQ